MLLPPHRDPHFALVWHSRALRVRNSRRAAAASQRRVLVAANRLAEASLSKTTPRLSRKFEGHAESQQRVRFRHSRTLLGSSERVSVSRQLLILSTQQNRPHPCFDGAAKRVALSSDFERASAARLPARSGEIPVTTGAHMAAASTHRPRGVSVADEGRDFGSREVDDDSPAGAGETADSGTDWAMTSACCPVTGSWDGWAPIAVDEGLEWEMLFGARARSADSRGIG